jgi:heptosyltransferase-2
MSTALIVKISAIGDVVMAIPAVRSLQRSYEKIDWVCGKTVEPVLQCYSWITTIPVDESKLLAGTLFDRFIELSRVWKRLAGRSYDMCATLQYDGKYRLIAAPIHAGRRVRLDSRHRSSLLLPDRHHSDEYARILLGGVEHFGGVPLGPEKPDQLRARSLLPEPTRLRVALAPGGAKNVLRDDALRRWPAESYSHLATALTDGGYEVVLLGGSTDHWVEPYFTRIPVINLIGLSSLPELIATLSDCDVVVTHDSGILHLAGLSDCGIVGLFGPTSPWGRLPRREYSVALWGGERLACRSCYDGREYAPCPANLCIREIDYRIVLSEVMEIASRRKARLPCAWKVKLIECGAAN